MCYFFLLFTSDCQTQSEAGVEDGRVQLAGDMQPGQVQAPPGLDKQTIGRIRHSGRFLLRNASTHSPNLPYSKGIGSPAAAIPFWKVIKREKLCRGKLKCTAGAPVKSPKSVQFLKRHSWSELFSVVVKNCGLPVYTEFPCLKIFPLHNFQTWDWLCILAHTFGIGLLLLMPKHSSVRGLPHGNLYFHISLVERLVWGADPFLAQGQIIKKKGLIQPEECSPLPLWFGSVFLWNKALDPFSLQRQHNLLELQAVLSSGSQEKSELPLVHVRNGKVMELLESRGKRTAAAQNCPAIVAFPLGMGKSRKKLKEPLVSCFGLFLWIG